MSRQNADISALDRRIGHNLRCLRQFYNLSQRELARHLDITFQQIQKYENGSNRLTASRLYELKSFYGVPYEYFFHGLDGIHHAEMEMISTDPLTLAIFNKIRSLSDDALKQKISHMIDIVAG